MLDILIKEEQELQFEHFDNETAFKLGSMLAQQAIDNNYPLMIEITIGSKLVYHYTHKDAQIYNHSWIKKKRNTVYYFGHSSYWVSFKLNKDPQELVNKYGLTTGEYAAVGGGFPINLKNFGQIGAISVSGFSKDNEDHELITDALKKILAEIS